MEKWELEVIFGGGGLLGVAEVGEGEEDEEERQ